MRLLLKLLLFPFVLILGIYAATPLWLPYIVARQLPPGWQLVKLDAGYWGFSGVEITSLRVKGELQAASVELIATDLSFSYRGLKTEVDSLTIDVYLRAVNDRSSDAITLNDLSLPVTDLTGEMPELSILKLRMALYHKVEMVLSNPLVLNFQSLKLMPRADSSYHVSTDVNMEGSQGTNGRVEVDVDDGAFTTDIRFPSDASSPSWLTVFIEQINQRTVHHNPNSGCF